MRGKETVLRESKHASEALSKENDGQLDRVYCRPAYALRRENLATEVLVRILEISSAEVVREFLGPYGVSGQ